MTPEGWSRKPLTNVAEIRTGVAKGKTGLKDPIEVPYLRVANVQDGHIDLTEVKRIEIERHQLERYSLEKGDVLMTEGGDFDKLGRGDVWQGQINPCLNQNHVFAVRVDKAVLLPYFLASLSGSFYGKSYFLSCAKRSTNLASINSTQLKEFPIVIPPLPEQRKIAKILQTWDRAIATTEKLIDASKQQKKALMQQLLTGKKRFAGFEGEWESGNVEDIAKVGSGGTPSRKNDLYWNGDIPWVTTTEVKFGMIKNTEQTITASGLENSSAKMFPPNTILIAMYGQGKTRGQVAKLSISASTNQACAALLLKKKHDSDFYFYYLMSQYENIRALANDGGQQNLSAGIVKKIPVPIPTTSEQTEIARALSTSSNEIEILVSKLTQLKQEKKALMQQLLTGKRRVKVDD